MRSYLYLIFGYASILTCNSSTISAQQSPPSATRHENVQQFTGNRSTQGQPTMRPAQTAATPEQQRNVKVKKGRAHPKVNTYVQTVAEAPQLHQYQGQRQNHAHQQVAVPAPQSNHAAVFQGSRNAAPQTQTITVGHHQTHSPVVIPKVQIGVTTAPVRQRPIVIQAALPKTIVINQRSAICPFVTLSPYTIAKKGNYIELSDGSIWQVRHRDRNKVKKWRSSDSVVIETSSFLSWYAYSLVNYSRNETIDVELYASDSWHGNAAHWIEEVNPFQGYVKLENGSIWHLSTSELAAWSVNDDVIIGLSKDWFSSQYNYVLINPKAKSRFTAIFQF